MSFIDCRQATQIYNDNNKIEKKDINIQTRR